MALSRVGQRHREQRVREFMDQIQDTTDTESPPMTQEPATGTVDAFLSRVRDAGWKTETRPATALTPRIGDIVTTYGDPTAYHVQLVGKAVSHLVADEADVDVWVNNEAVTVAARLTNGRWRDTRPHLGPAII